MWGKPRELGVSPATIRIIPTGVGKTARFAPANPLPADHPHGCGENHNCTRTIRLLHGSSPRVWGKPFVAVVRIPTDRIIPTGVGKTPPAGLNASRWADHPHGCGENATEDLQAAIDYGSSPRVWGKPLREVFSMFINRIIPTGVGKTTTPPRTARGWTDHPHGCGENFHRGCSFESVFGSSPRVWGKLRNMPPA